MSESVRTLWLVGFPLDFTLNGSWNTKQQFLRWQQIRFALFDSSRSIQQLSSIKTSLSTVPFRWYVKIVGFIGGVVESRMRLRLSLLPHTADSMSSPLSACHMGEVEFYSFTSLKCSPVIQTIPVTSSSQTV